MIPISEEAYSTITSEWSTGLMTCAGQLGSYDPAAMVRDCDSTATPSLTVKSQCFNYSSTHLHTVGKLRIRIVQSLSSKLPTLVSKVSKPRGGTLHGPL